MEIKISIFSIFTFMPLVLYCFTVIERKIDPNLLRANAENKWQLETSIYADLVGREHFKSYYRCVQKKCNKFINNNLEVSLLVEEDDELKLICKTCFRPDEPRSEFYFAWKRKIIFAKKEEGVVETDHIKISPEGTLVIAKVTIDDAGRYTCFRNDIYQNIYRVDVIRRVAKEQVFQTGLPGKRASPNETLADKNLLVFSKWTEWTTCNRCDKRGERRRTGICTVKKLDNSLPVQTKDYHVFTKYRDGVPCRSTLMPMAVYSLPEVRSRKGENMLGYCFVVCPNQETAHKVFDDNGNVVEIVNKKAGYVSMREGPPEIPPAVDRKFVYATIGRPLALECPKIKAENTGIRWQNDSQVLDLVTLKRRTHGRVMIDDRNRLMFSEVNQWDSAPFSCWNQGQHIATLTVSAKNAIWDRSLEDYVVFFGMIGSFLVFGNVALHVFKGRNKRTIR